eukprot:7985712-Pyramimonas_sp.AAC.1
MVEIEVVLNNWRKKELIMRTESEDDTFSEVPRGKKASDHPELSFSMGGPLKKPTKTDKTIFFLISPGRVKIEFWIPSGRVKIKFWIPDATDESGHFRLGGAAQRRRGREVRQRRRVCQAPDCPSAAGEEGDPGL